MQQQQQPPVMKMGGGAGIGSAPPKNNNNFGGMNFDSKHSSNRMDDIDIDMMYGGGGAGKGGIDMKAYMLGKEQEASYDKCVLCEKQFSKEDE